MNTERIHVAELTNGMFICKGLAFKSLDTLKNHIREFWKTENLLIRSSSVNEDIFWLDNISREITKVVD